MGVKSLWEILGPTARPVRLEALSRKKLAVDASIWIYQFLKAVRDSEGNALAQSHIVGFFRRICKLLYFGIYPIFVFDGGAPVLKRETILQRKQKREGHTETTRQTAQKLLAIQVQRQAEKYLASKSKSKSKSKPEDEAMYLEDLPINHPMHGEKHNQLPDPVPTSTRFLKTDEYHLPKIDKFKVSTQDSRIMPEDEFNESLAEFDYVDGIDINTLDPNSKEFLQLPIETQYMALSHLRLKSRLRMGYRKDQLEALFPNSMDFSKFQIQQVQKRNFYTQKLMNVAGMGDDGNATRRIAGDKDRKYALVKNDDGWTLSIRDESSEGNPIVLDEDGNEVKNPFALPDSKLKKEDRPMDSVNPKNENQLSDDSDDFEDVDLNVEENEEDKQQQMALIESIYNQYEDNSSGVPTIDGFHEADLRKAIENSKLDLEKLYREEAELDTRMRESSASKASEISGGLGGSFLFATKSKIPLPTTKEKTIPINPIKNNEHNVATKPVLTSEQDLEFGGSFLFGSASVVDTTKETKVQVPMNREESSRANEEIVKIDSEEDSSSETDEIEEELPQNINIQIDHGENKDQELSDVPEESKRQVQSIPSWFNEGISESNLHQQASISETKDNREKYVEDEDAGLIPWNEAKDMLLNDEQDFVNVVSDNDSEEDYIEEIAPPNETGKNEVHKAKEPQPEAETRKAQIIDYDFEDDDGADLLNQLREEEDDHETFKINIKKSHEIPLSSINSSITQEQMLQEKLNKEKRDSEEVTQTMISDVQELLRRFGIPYITAPMEAEAQCAELLKLNLVDGIITDDSDCFLFGGDRVYKNMFNQKQYVECYIAEEIQREIGLNQDKLIELALLLGSDYTEGIKGIGPVLAMEILAYFGSLKEFKKWFDEQTKTITAKNTQQSGLRKTLLGRIRSGKLFLNDSFPDQVVFSAYKSPEVDHDSSEFKWGVPSLDQIRSYLMYNVNWSQARVDEVMVPLIRDMNRKKQEGTQSTIGEFFPQEYIQSRKELNLGKRIKSAASKLNKKAKTS